MTALTAKTLQNAFERYVEFLDEHGDRTCPYIDVGNSELATIDGMFDLNVLAACIKEELHAR